MGGKQSLLQETDNTIKTEVTNINEQYVKLVYDTVTNITSSINTSVTNNLKSQNQCNNNSNQKGDIASGSGSEILNIQTCDLDIVFQATINALVNNNASTTQLQNMTNDISSKLQNNSSLSTDMTALNSITSQKQTDGEINATIDAIKGVISGIGSKTSNQYITKTDVENTITNKNISNTDIQNIVNNTLTDSINTNAITNCFNTNTGSNYSDQSAAVAINGGKIISKQDVYVKSLNTCVAKNILSTTMMQDVVDTVANTAQMDASNSTSIMSKIVSSLKSFVSDITTSIAGIIGNNIMFTILGIVLLIVILGIFFLKFLKPRPKQIVSVANTETATLAKSSFKYFLTQL